MLLFLLKTVNLPCLILYCKLKQELDLLVQMMTSRDRLRQLSHFCCMKDLLKIVVKCIVIIITSFRSIERFFYDLEQWFPEVFVICFISQWLKRSKHGLFVFPPKKTLMWRGHCSIGHARLYPFDKPVKSLYFRSF